MTNTISRIASAVLSSANSSSPENLFNRILSELKNAYLEITDEDEREAFMQEKFPLRQLGVEVLIIRLCRESLHRVFNRGSFTKNGRAYGAQHQSLPKDLRKHILINGQKTVEPDFSAYHMLMLYHMEGIDYADDPYTVIGGPDNRDLFKSVCLISINAKLSKAWRAIKEKLKEQKIKLPGVKRPYVSLLEKVRDAHAPIAHHIGADKGIDLQNIDSHIMNAILMRLMDMGILGLSVFDSVIAVQDVAEIVRGIMIEEYREGIRVRSPEYRKHRYGCRSYYERQPEHRLHPEATPQPRKLWISKCHRNEVLYLQNEKPDEEVVFFEDLEPDIQNAIIDLIASVIENHSLNMEDINV